MNHLFVITLAGCLSAEQVSALQDRDNDGETAVEAGGSDCDDADSSINTAAEERCGDGLDNNCDGMIDDAGVGASEYFPDLDAEQPVAGCPPVIRAPAMTATTATPWYIRVHMTAVTASTTTVMVGLTTMASCPGTPMGMAIWPEMTLWPS